MNSIPVGPQEFSNLTYTEVPLIMMAIVLYNLMPLKFFYGFPNVEIKILCL